MQEFEAREDDSEFRLFVAVRAFSSLVDPEKEFRCFVSNGKLTAVSQYDYDCFFPRLQNQEFCTAIVTSINDFVVRYALTVFKAYQSMVMDVLVDLEDDNFGVTLIELNPFDDMTDGALFHWSKDANIIHNGLREGPAFRVKQDRKKGFKPQKWWLDILRTFLEQHGET